MTNPDVLFGRLGNRMFQMAYLYSQLMDRNIPDIYLQDETYFKKHSYLIRQLYGSDIGKIDQIAVHVRRGDYVDNNFYVDLTKTDYYQLAMGEFPKGQFLVFSDDIAWCKKQDMFKGCEFVDEQDPIKAINLMASCVGHIIANSSFSWWGAYISPHDGAVICPIQWYADEVERTKCPTKWKRI
jgi:hypothetical protein